MDANLIYTKTPSGEDAVRQRTRVVQRNTRMVLILVDGKSTVDDLCEKTGNRQLVESALQELERDGLIAPKLEQDSMWDQSRKVAEEIKAAAIRRLAKEEPLLSEAPVPLSPPAVAPKVPLSAEPFSVGSLSNSPSSVYPVLQSIAPASTFGSEPSSAPLSMGSAPPVVEEADTDVAGKRLSGLSSLFARRDDDSIKPIRRGRSLPYVSWPLAAALGVVGIVALAAVVFVAYPYDRHRADFEAGLSRLTGQNVRIGSVHASFSPRPAISLESVAVGDGEQARAARIRVVPKIFSLLASRPAFSEVEVESAVFDGPALAILPRLFAATMQADSPATVDRLAFSRLQLALFGLSVGDLQGEMLRAENLGGPLAVVSADRSLRLQIRSEGAGMAVDFEGYGWSARADSPYKFDSIQGRAVWDGRSLALSGLDARIFDGAIRGTVVMERGEQPTLAADIEVKHMSVARLATALGYANQFEGDLAGSLRFTGQSPEWSGVLQRARGDGNFVLQRGSLGGLDLVEAVRRAGKGSVTGGVTRYESVTGRLQISPETIRFADLALASGALRAGGMLDVARDGKLAGRLEVEIRGSATVLRVPVIASATLRSPELRAGR